MSPWQWLALLSIWVTGSGGRGVEQDLVDNEAKWIEWLGDYIQGVEICNERFREREAVAVPSLDDWPALREIVLAEILPATRVAIINSDGSADERPDFSFRAGENRAWFAPRNLSTVFVAGNVMSRGITLEGLTTTLFTRSADSPVADTQMQMQRWFGFRGDIVDLCRVLTSSEQLRLFEQYHENDEALRKDVLAAMESDSDVLPDISILQGRSFRATAKIRDVSGVALFPGHRPFFRLMNPAGEDEETRRRSSVHSLTVWTPSSRKRDSVDYFGKTT